MTHRDIARDLFKRVSHASTELLSVASAMPVIYGDGLFREIGNRRAQELRQAALDLVAVMDALFEIEHDYKCGTIANGRTLSEAI